MNDPKLVAPLVSLAVPYGWRMVFLVNALAWTVPVHGFETPICAYAATDIGLI